jgi:hypothetical protein
MNHRSVALLLLIVFYITPIFAEPNGVVLYRNGKRQGYHNVSPTAEHHYFGYLEGPAWENKYSAFRYYIDKDDRNVIDIIGKIKDEAILQHFSDTAVDEHKEWPWGTDILKVNSAMGLGAFRLFNNNTWMNPQIPENIDSLVIIIKDSSVQTPELQIGYYGWNIGSGNKINALLTISTTFNERPTHCELAITGNYTGKVAIGMVNHRDNASNPNRSSIKLIQDQDPPLLATIGKQGGLQEGFADTLLMAVFADKSYFDSFVNNGTTNYGMILKPDIDKKVQWSIAYSWARETNPLYRNTNWKTEIRGTTGIISPVDKHITSHLQSTTNTVRGEISEYFSLSGKSVGFGSSIGIAGNPHAQGLYIMRQGGSAAARFVWKQPEHE